MSARLYNRLTTGSLVVAVIAALFFERLGRLYWIAGLFGILAGATAVITYFVHQSCISDETCSEDDVVQRIPTTDLLFDMKTDQPSGIKNISLYVNDFVSYDVVSFFQEKGGYGSPILQNFVSYSQTDVVDVGIGSTPTDQFVGYVVEIVDKLCATDKDLEFEVTREGNLLIRQPKRASWHHIAAISETQAEPTLHFPEKVH